MKALGTHSYAQNTVLVDFRWLILPGFVYITILVFFISTIATTRKTPMWKSSPLPLLHAKDREDNDGSGERVRQRAKESWLRLRRGEMRWQLVDSMEFRESKERTDP